MTTLGMNVYLQTDYETAIEQVIAALQKEGFGVLTEIDVKATLKKKLDVDFRPYKILGACNAPFAYKALQAEDKIGTMLPCNVIVQELDNGKIEVAAIDPMASMQAVKNESLGDVAQNAILNGHGLDFSADGRQVGRLEHRFQSCRIQVMRVEPGMVATQDFLLHQFGWIADHNFEHESIELCFG